MRQLPTIGIEGIAYSIPQRRFSIDELSSAHKIVSSEAALRSFGFEYCHIAERDEMRTLLESSARKTIADSGLAVADIGTLILYSGLGFEYALPKKIDTHNSPLDLFRYPVARLANTLGLSHARTFALSQEGCNGLFSALALAEKLLDTSEKHTLCVFGDMLPDGVSREIMYNVMSDAAASAIVRHDAKKNFVRSFSTLSHPYYWDTPTCEAELLAAYFPMALRAISNALRDAGLTPEDIKWVIPHNVSLRSWEILAKLICIPEERIWLSNIARIGHTVSTDHFINLADMEKANMLKSGDKLLFFGFGFGASWSTMIIEH